jgi:hypothetical protein
MQQQSQERMAEINAHAGIAKQHMSNQGQLDQMQQGMPQEGMPQEGGQEEDPLGLR